LEVTKFL
jgi:hypothetical protein